MGPNEQAKVARRLASVMEWAAALNYLIMHPDVADVEYVHRFGALVENREQAMAVCAQRIRMHGAVIDDILRGA
jgi:hypothetical protein